MLNRKSPAIQGNQELKHPLPTLLRSILAEWHPLELYALEQQNWNNFSGAKSAGLTSLGVTFIWATLPGLIKAQVQSMCPGKQSHSSPASLHPIICTEGVISGIFNTAPTHPSSLHAENTTTLQAQPFSPYFLFICTAQVSPSPHTSCFYALHRLALLPILPVYMHCTGL